MRDDDKTWVWWWCSWALFNSLLLSVTICWFVLMHLHKAFSPAFLHTHSHTPFCLKGKTKERSRDIEPAFTRELKKTKATHFVYSALAIGKTISSLHLLLHSGFDVQFGPAGVTEIPLNPYQTRRKTQHPAWMDKHMKSETGGQKLFFPLHTA